MTSCAQCLLLGRSRLKPPAAGAGGSGPGQAGALFLGLGDVLAVALLDEADEEPGRIVEDGNGDVACTVTPSESADWAFRRKINAALRELGHRIAIPFQQADHSVGADQMSGPDDHQGGVGVLQPGLQSRQPCQVPVDHEALEGLRGAV